MGSITLGQGDVIPAIRPVVTVDGVRRSDLFCTSVECGLGTAGSTASFEAPAMRWTDGRGLLDREVRVAVDGVAVFAGVIHSRTAAVSGGQDGVAFGAVSFVGYAAEVFVGQERTAGGGQVEFVYPRFARRGGVLAETGWSVKSVLRDIFSSNGPSWKGGGANLPSGWRARLALGTMSVLDTTYNSFPIGDVAFRMTTLAEALEQLLADIPTVSFRERVTAGKTYLDFFELGDPTAPARRVIVARPGEHVAAVGGNVLEVGRSDSLEGVKSRVIGVGAHARTMISVSTAHATAPLEKGWNPALEAAVLADPEKAKKYTAGHGGGAMAYGKVFRRYRLPAAVRGLLIEEKNALRGSDGEELPIQVWKFGRTYGQDAEGRWVSEPAAVPELIEGAKLDIASGEVVLSAPAIDLLGSYVAGGAIVETWGEAVVGVTLTVRGGSLVADAGRDGPEGVSGGLCHQVLNESFESSRVNGTVGGHAFETCWAFDGALGPAAIAGPVVVRSDLALLRTYAALALREANRIRTSYTVTVPYFTEGFRLGDRVELVGEDGAPHGTHQVRSLAWDLTADHATRLSTDNQVPLLYQSLGGAR